MEILEHIDSARSYCDAARASGKKIGFVPTMGYLHDGHLAHLHALRPLVDVLITSIYVNPTQFAAGEDLDKYPRETEGDAQKLRNAGCDALFLPTSTEMYPDGYNTYVTVGTVTEHYEGAFRPEHFRGVSTIVAKLFNIIQPHIATFGQKDAQQVAVVRKMVEDLNFGIELMLIETVREPDGLAMSSRNVYLSEGERQEGLSISRALRYAKEALAEGASVEKATDLMRSTLSPALRPDYADIIDSRSFSPATDESEELLGIIAAYSGTTRLIDNMPFERKK